MRYFLKAIGATDNLLVDRWIEDRPELLRSVRNPFTPRAIGKGDLLVYYATGHQRLIAIARATQDGAESQTDVVSGEERWPHVLSVQVLLAISTVKLSPDWSVLGIKPTTISQKPYVEITAAQYALAWTAIVERTNPNVP